MPERPARGAVQSRSAADPDSGMDQRPRRKEQDRSSPLWAAASNRRRRRSRVNQGQAGVVDELLQSGSRSDEPVNLPAGGTKGLPQQRQKLLKLHRSQKVVIADTGPRSALMLTEGLRRRIVAQFYHRLGSFCIGPAVCGTRSPARISSGATPQHEFKLYRSKRCPLAAIIRPLASAASQ